MNFRHNIYNKIILYVETLSYLSEALSNPVLAGAFTLIIVDVLDVAWPLIIKYALTISPLPMYGKYCSGALSVTSA